MDKKQTLYLAGAFAAAVSFGSPVEAASGGKEKCYGAALTGKNSCGSKDGSHSCAGQSTSDCDANEWKYVPVGTCEEAKAQCKKEAGLK